MRRLFEIAFFILALTVTPLAVAANGGQRVHTVYAGQRLGSIAKRYNVTVEAICRANGIAARDVIKPGQKLVIPRDGDDGSHALRSGGGSTNQSQPRETPQAELKVHKVYAGQRLGSIAKRYNVTLAALCNANALAPTDVIKPGQQLVIPSKADRDGSQARRVRSRYVRDERKPSPNTKAPGGHASRPSAPPNRKSWDAYSRPPWRRGYVTVIGHHNSWKGYVIGPGNRLLPAARRAISRVLAWPHKDKLINSRLIRLMARVSDEFGGRPLRVVSGYRTRSFARESRHKMGRAADFRVVGVPNNALRDYLRTLGQVGVGYYPNSSFVHLDVRRETTYWVDLAGPGQAPRYQRIVKD